MSFDRSWGAVVYKTPGKSGADRLFLLVKLASGNHWDHPKGHPEPGETPQETARREIREEGGVEVALVDGFYREAEWVLPDGRPKKVGYFLARESGTAPAGGPTGEILDSAWLPFGAARERITYESGRRVLDDAMKFLGD